MRIIIVRHGESRANKKKEHQGKGNKWTDTPLSGQGRIQARQVAERLKDEKIDEIYSSDLKRARKTAEQINKFHHLKITFLPELREYMDNETKEELILRVKKFFNSVKNKDKTILVVAHGAVNLTLLAISTGNRKKGAHIARKARQHNTGVSILEKEGKHYIIKEMGNITHLRPNKKIIKIFEKVQKIPYRVSPFNENKIKRNLKFGDCRHKSFLLAKLLKKVGVKVKIIKVIFDWKDLPIPKEILSTLKNSSTVQVHTIVWAKIHGNYLYLDPTWPTYLEKKGFPVTKDWNGLEDTKQVTKGELTFFKKDDFNERKDEILKRYKIKMDKGEMHNFADKLNKWINS